VPTEMAESDDPHAVSALPHLPDQRLSLARARHQYSGELDASTNVRRARTPNSASARRLRDRRQPKRSSGPRPCLAVWKYGASASRCSARLPEDELGCDVGVAATALVVGREDPNGKSPSGQSRFKTTRVSESALRR